MAVRESNQNNANRNDTNPAQGGPIDLEKVKQFAGMIQQWCADPKRKEDLLHRLGDAKDMVRYVAENAKSFFDEKTAGFMAKAAEGNAEKAEGADYESMLSKTVAQCMDFVKAAAPKLKEMEQQAVEKIKSDETAEKVKGMTEGIRRRLADLLMTGLEPKQESEKKDGGDQKQA